MSDKLLIDLWGATISADGIYAIVAAVIIVLALVRWRRAARATLRLCRQVRTTSVSPLAM
jgi:hypothetical protein